MIANHGPNYREDRRAFSSHFRTACQNRFPCPETAVRARRLGLVLASSSDFSHALATNAPGLQHRPASCSEAWRRGDCRHSLKPSAMHGAVGKAYAQVDRLFRSRAVKVASVTDLAAASTSTSATRLPALVQQLRSAPLSAAIAHRQPLAAQRLGLPPHYPGLRLEVVTSIVAMPHSRPSPRHCCCATARATITVFTRISTGQQCVSNAGHGAAIGCPEGFRGW